MIVNATCAAAKKLLPENVDIKLCVNLSAKQFEDIELGNRILEAVQAQNLDSSSVVFEITESTAISDSDISVTVIDKLMRSGFELAIDDFGTGYSSLARLRQLSVSWFCKAILWPNRYRLMNY